MTNRHIDQSILRIIDAATNRAGEGLRVVEDFCRMHLEDGVLTAMAKETRHALTASLSAVDFSRLVSARDTINDVGAAISTSDEYRRAGCDELLRANFARVQQSLRTIEEYAKLFDSSVAIGVERIRYSTYSLEKAIACSIQANVDLANARLYVLTDLRSNLNSFESLIRELIAAEVDLIQLRDKSATDRQLVQAGVLLTKLTRNSSTRWIMNDRPDLAVIADADGVHIGQDDLTVKQVRDVIGPNRIIGVSTHDIEQARAAVMDCPTYIAIGPVFASVTKSLTPLASHDFIRQVVEEFSLPTFAIGGIDEHNLSGLIGMGVQRIAVSHAVVAAKSPTNTVSRLRTKLSVPRVKPNSPMTA